MGGARGLGLILLVCSCARAPEAAIGRNNEISLLTNVPRGGAVERALRACFEAPVEVVGPEPSFRLDVVSRDALRVHRAVKNQIVAVDVSEDDAWSRDLPGWLADEEAIARRDPFRRIVRDRWAAGQTTLFLVGWSSEDLMALLGEPEALAREFEDSVISGLAQTMYSFGEDTALARELARDVGWTLRIPTGYALARPSPRTVKLDAHDPVRLLLVHWEDGPLPLEEDAWRPVLARVLAQANDGDSVMVERTRAFAGRFQDAPALRWEGVWQNARYTIGGPFRALAIQRPPRSYLLVGQVFAPGGDKVVALRQVEALLHTFREAS